MVAGGERWDVFCRVVDNYGDVAVAWRLSRALAREHGKRVRLYLDDLTVLARLRPATDAALERQRIDIVDVCRWPAAMTGDARLPDAEIADVVVETFGCDTPEPYVRAMAARRPMPRWINLEYLSAEAWVEGSHALPSPHPRYAPLTRHFFFPGFTGRTGGLLRERDLVGRRDAFQADRATQAQFWRALAGESPPDAALKVSLFGYAGAPYEGLFECLRRSPGDVWLAVPEGAAATALAAWRARTPPRAMGSLRALAIPFLDQDFYDELLWACDLNFVRGEDSFVRAQWAARPFVWHIYPTDDGAHWVKLAAFLARYTGGMERSHAAAFTHVWEAWNRNAPMGRAWPEFEERLPALAPHAEAWSARLARQADLATQLVDFADNVLI